MLCACLSTPAHSSFHNGQPSSVHHGGALRSGRAPGAAVQGEGSSSLPRQLQQRSPRKDAVCPGLLGAQSSTQLLARRQAPRWSGSSAHAHRSGWGVTVVLLRSAILPGNPHKCCLHSLLKPLMAEAGEALLQMYCPVNGRAWKEDLRSNPQAVRPAPPRRSIFL